MGHALLYVCAYVRAQVEVAMAGWTTEETRALLGLWGAADAHNRAHNFYWMIDY